MRFLPSLGQKVHSEASSGLPLWSYGRPYTPMTGVTMDGAKLIRESYERNAWVYRCVNAYAEAQAQLPIGVFDSPAEDARALDGHVLLDLLGHEANDFASAYHFRFQVSAQLLLSTRGVFIEKIPGRDGRLAGLALLPPHLTQPIPDENTFVSAYRVWMGGVPYDVPGERIEWLRNPHPVEQYRSMTPLEAAGIAVDTDWMAHLFNRNYLANGGAPAGMLAIRSPMLPQDMDELQARFSGAAPKGWVIVESEQGIDAQTLTGSPNDAMFVETHRLSKEEVLAAFGVPETIIGDASERTFSNAEQEREVWWEDRMPPHLRLVGNGFDRLDPTTPTFVRFDTEKVGPLVRLAEARARTAREEVVTGCITPNEYRIATGRDPLSDPAADTLYHPMTAVPYAAALGIAIPTQPTSPAQTASRLPLA